MARQFLHPLAAIILIAACARWTGATAQNLINPASPTSCPQAADLSAVHLYGLWRAEFEGLPQPATVLFERHAELAGSVSGHINRDGVKAQIAGDVDDGELALDESLDGHNISATWTGTVVDHTCGKEIKGTWNNTLPGTPGHRSYPFVLRKLPGWQ